MQRTFFILFFLFCLYSRLLGTHNRAGEITYRHLGGYSFEFTISTYTYRLSNANRNELTILWGDGFSDVVPLILPRIVPEGSDYFFNTYKGTHTYPGPGVYEVLMEDPNRNLGVNNIPNSVNTIFSIKTTLLVDVSIGANNTPVLLNPPVDNAARGHIFIHNPAAYDADGDSISYALTVCTGASGQPIEGYTLPAYTDTLEMNEVTGDLQWVTPAETGVYNVAILVEEWRKGVRIGRIARDMQIDVFETENNPPVTTVIPDYCVFAGETVNISIQSTDADGDPMTQSMAGGSFQVNNPADFEVLSSANGSISSRFVWDTDCSHARQQPYNLVLRTEDVNDDITLVDITSFSVKVLHKAPLITETFPGVDTIRIEWEPVSCTKPGGYNVYRRLGSYEYEPDSCETGLPGYTGYTFLESVSGAETNAYTDDNLGEGLVPGFDYCYRITAYYSDGAESASSEEICSRLVAGTPPILKVSVSKDDEINGEIDLAWAVVPGIDTIDEGPYRYRILRMSPGQEDFTLVTDISTADLRDTTFKDTGINTMIFPYTYSVILFYEEEGIWYPLSGAEQASSQYLLAEGSDNEILLTLKKHAPWLNNRYDVFRRSANSVFFDSVGSVTDTRYLDSGLPNNREFTYRTRGYGIRPLFGTEYDVDNVSHLVTGMPVDSVPPCPPDFYVSSECDSTIAYNHLSWSMPADCEEDEVISYILYNRDSLSGIFEVMDTLSPDVSSYKDFPEHSIEKCYAVTAIDSFYNESEILPGCVYNICAFYRLPNVFSPNGDGINDIYYAWNLNDYIKKVKMTIYNRYGKLVFETENPSIDWDGRSKENDKLMSTGVYYYVCEVYEPRISGLQIITLTGFIHLYSGDDNEHSE